MPKVEFDMVVIFDETPDEFYGTPGRVLTVLANKIEVQIYKELDDARDPPQVWFERDDSSMNGMLSWSICGNWKIDRVYTL